MFIGFASGQLNDETGMTPYAYYKESGERAVDEWFYWDGNWYYANPRTADATSKCIMSGKPYWVSPGYYCNEFGEWVPGPHMPGIEEETYPMVDYEPEINVQAQGKCYYLDTGNGAMAKNTYIDGYYVNEAGV